LSCELATKWLIYNHMVVNTQNPVDADALFHALADSTRRDILRHSLVTELSVSALARRYPMSFAAIQKHVMVLERAELVTKRRHGREQLVRGNVQTIASVVTLLDEYEAVLRDRSSRIDRILSDEEERGEDQ
jgi:DNA-binding transcriptional ArsR family regulator